MNDKDIRKILINFLLAERQDIRIYQEKSIGSSICDVMAVSSHLTGYEIKSDSDDYSRLDRQVSAYDDFFDKNYLVISQKHRKSAENKVPRHWGIINIEQDSVEILRRAADNPNVSRRSQLTVLWKLELKNILVKNSMPMYAQKDKKYISYQISKQVDPAILGKQIANELYNRDYSYYVRIYLLDNLYLDLFRNEWLHFFTITSMELFKCRFSFTIFCCFEKRFIFIYR